MKRPGRKPLLTVPAVRLIRRVYDAAKAAGRRPRVVQFSRRYSVHRNTIWQICHRATYKWVRP